KGPLKKDFANVDLDEDGYITEEEFKKAPKPKRPPKRQ
ncbi:MAG: EF-hand domain-containing protein, partial [Bacteroidota bacterium]